MVSGAFALDDRGLTFRRGEVEVERYESLPCAGFQVLQHALIARVVRHDQLKARCSLDRLAGLVDRQDASMVGQRMQYDYRVLPRFDDLIEIADCALAYRSREQAVLPYRTVVANQEAADQV